MWTNVLLMLLEERLFITLREHCQNVLRTFSISWDFIDSLVFTEIHPSLQLVNSIQQIYDVWLWEEEEPKMFDVTDIEPAALVTEFNGVGFFWELDSL